MNQFKNFGIKPILSSFSGDKIKIDKILNMEILILKFKIEPSKHKVNTNCMTLQIEKQGIKHVIFTGSSVLMQMIQLVPEDKFPFRTTIVKESEHLEFT